jgi:hypothetical protein
MANRRIVTVLPQQRHRRLELRARGFHHVAHAVGLGRAGNALDVDELALFPDAFNVQDRIGTVH